jgi:hypothetical protein
MLRVFNCAFRFNERARWTRFRNASMREQFLVRSCGSRWKSNSRVGTVVGRKSYGFPLWFYTWIRRKDLFYLWLEDHIFLRGEFVDSIRGVEYLNSPLSMHFTDYRLTFRPRIESPFLKNLCYRVFSDQSYACVSSQLRNQGRQRNKIGCRSKERQWKQASSAIAFYWVLNSTLFAKWPPCWRNDGLYFCLTSPLIISKVH